MTATESAFKFNFGDPPEPAAASKAHQYQTDDVEIMDELQLRKGRVQSNAAAQLVQEAGVQESDLLPGRYEGGFKLWEGALDLARCLCAEWSLGGTLISQQADPCPQLIGKQVLELGCGHGMPGIVLLLAGASVHFQDFNEEVLTALTAANVAANRQRLSPMRRPLDARYFAGDWSSFSGLVNREGLGGSYDYIVSAETLYSEASQLQLYECIKQSLKPPSGIAFIAAKSHYFGCGGGTASFKRLLKREGILTAKVLKTIDDGQGNKREVLKLTFPECLYPYFL